MPAQSWAGFFMPGNRSAMTLDGLFRWLEKNHGKHAADEKAVADWETDGGAVTEDPPEEVTSEGDMTLPPISGGVPDGE